MHLDAAIGSAAMMAAAKKHIEHRYTFEKSKDGQLVKGWDEILELLKPATPPENPQNRLPLKEVAGRELFVIRY